VTAAIETEELGKRYRKTWALAGCTLSIPAGHVAGLVGPNGAGKTTLLNLATGMLAPTAGTIEVLGGRPALDNCLARHGIRVAMSYQPLGRYWPLQFAETGLFVTLALALAWYCFWRLNRRRS
jgi:ABC-type multidrug transport system ATPase subunit